MNVYQRIVAVMRDVNYIQKEDKKVNNQYRFVSHDAVTAALHAPCVKHGLVVMPSVLEYKQDGNRTEMTIEITFINAEKPEERLTTKSVGYGIDQQDKGTGKAYSYAFKMALLKSFMLESGEEDNEIRFAEHKKNDSPNLTGYHLYPNVQNIPSDKEFFKAPAKAEENKPPSINIIKQTIEKGDSLEKLIEIQRKLNYYEFTGEVALEVGKLLDKRLTELKSDKIVTERPL